MPWHSPVAHAPLDPRATCEACLPGVVPPRLRTVARWVRRGLSWTATSLLMGGLHAAGAVGQPPPVSSNPPPPPEPVVATTSTNRHVLDFDTIVRLVHRNNPTVRAAREEMEAAQHGL